MNISMYNPFSFHITKGYRLWPGPETQPWVWSLGARAVCGKQSTMPCIWGPRFRCPPTHHTPLHVQPSGLPSYLAFKSGPIAGPWEGSSDSIFAVALDFFVPTALTRVKSGGGELTDGWANSWPLAGGEFVKLWPGMWWTAQKKEQRVAK